MYDVVCMRIGELEMIETPRLLWNVREAGIALGLSPWTIRLYIRQRKLRVVRVGRRILLEPHECCRFIERCKVQSEERGGRRSKHQ